MIKVELRGLLKESGSSQVEGAGWVEWRALELLDVERDRKVAEWFYIAACDKNYYDGLADRKGYFVQSSFDEGSLFDSAREVLNKLSFNDWDDFYDKMNQHFIHEDSMA